MAGTRDPVVSETTPGPQVRTDRARQGQNVRGMLTVLIVSVFLLAAAYGVMLLIASQTSGLGTRAGEKTIPPAGTTAPPPTQ